MGAEQAVAAPRQPSGATAEQPTGDTHVVGEPLDFRQWPCNRPLPKKLRDQELADLLGYRHAAFFRRKKAGHFRFLEVEPQLPDSLTLYSGARVDRWLDGPHEEVPDTTRRTFFKTVHAAERKRPGRRTATPTFGDGR